MSRNYDNWEKLVEAVLRREKDRQLALFESFSSSVFSSRPSFDSDVSAGAPSSQSNFISHIQFVEITLSTQNFHPDTLLGEGRFGPLYKGWIHEHFLTAVKPGSGIAVAIRKLNRRRILSLNRPHHSNLVKLIGYSFDGGNRVLVYQFMPNGSLDNHLFLRGHQPLSWETRLKVAIGAGRGLSLFHDLRMLVTHESVKSSSILLDDELNANWSDFCPTTVPILSHRNDYASPEYIAKGALTMKSDVYSFGIILLELLCGLRVFDKNRPMKEQNLVVWAKPYLSNKRKLLQIVDSRLEDLYPHDEAYEFGKVAFKCLSLDPKLRPSMAEVVDILERFGSDHYRQNQTEVQTGIDRLMDPARSSNWPVLGPVSRSSGPRIDPADPSSQHILFFRNVMAIEYGEIKRATKKFGPDTLLGQGRFGPVYKGWIHEHNLSAVKPGFGLAVAVKKLNLEGLQGHTEWLVDAINYLSQLRHPNLVRLIGYSFNEDDRILVYEFMARGSLSNHLFTKGGHGHLSLPWSTRVKVALGVARALTFLHGLEVPVIHRNVKSGDILLDGDFNPKLSDIGLAIDGLTGDETYILTQVMGTHLKNGYAAPEYVAAGSLSHLKFFPLY